MHATLPLLVSSDFPAINRDLLHTLQINVGYRCNQQCLHCHVNASPKRKESMDKNTLEAVLAFMQRTPLTHLDITGGAPELNPYFRQLVRAGRDLNLTVIDRSNLTILEEPGQEDLAEFLAQYQVEISASLPCYSQENVDAQRGDGVFEKSIRSLQKLNGQGYGIAGSGLILNLVYNPGGPFLPPPQQSLQQEYKTRLKSQYGIEFNALFTLANMPIQRFGSTLISKGQFNAYMQLLKNAHQENNLAGVMCKTLISVDWQGFVYDCDFNQMLALPLALGAKPKTHISEVNHKVLNNNPISIADHCYACTAGQGSSCGGALV